MSEDKGIDRDVENFILTKIDSFEHMEILLLLYQRPTQGWTAAGVSQALRNSADSAVKRLTDLERDGLLYAEEKGGVKEYWFKPRDEKLANTVAKLAKTYSERRVTVINLIFSKPLKNIQVFADAFKVRKD